MNPEQPFKAHEDFWRGIRGSKISFQWYPRNVRWKWGQVTSLARKTSWHLWSVRLQFIFDDKAHCLLEGHSNEGIQWDVADKQTGAHGCQVHPSNVKLWRTTSHVPKVAFQSMWTVSRNEYHLRQLEEYPDGKTDSSLHGVCTVLVEYCRHVSSIISTHQFRQYFSTFLRYSGDVFAPMLSVALCDVQSAEVCS